MRTLKFIGKTLLGIIVLVLIFWTLILGVLQTKKGQAWVFHHVTRYLEHQTDSQISIEHIHYSFPLSLRLENVTVARNNEPLLKVQDMEVVCMYPPLFEGRLICSKLYAAHIDVLALPPSKETPSSSESSTFALNTKPWPFYIKFESINIQKIRVAPEIAARLPLPDEIRTLIPHASLTIQGIASNNPFKEAISAHLLVTVQDEVHHTTPFSIGIDTQSHYLSLSFHGNSSSLPLANFQLPPELKTHVALYASAPIHIWQNFIQNDMQPDEMIEGHLKLSLQYPADDTWLTPLIGERTIVKSRYILHPKQAVELFDLQIDAPHFMLEGGIILTADREIHHGNFKGEFKNLEYIQTLLDKDLEGKILFEGHASGPLQTPSLVVHLESPSLIISHKLFEDVRSTVQASAIHQGLEGFLTLAFDHQTIPWQMATSFRWDDHKYISLSHLRLDALRSRVQGELNCSTEDFIWEGLLESQTGNLQDIAHFFDLPLRGEAQLRIHLHALADENQHKHQGLQGELKGHSLQWADWQANRLHVNFHTDPLRTEKDIFQIYARLESDQITQKDLRVEIGHCLMETTQKIDWKQHTLTDLSTDWSFYNISWATGEVAQVNGRLYMPYPMHEWEGKAQFIAQHIRTPTAQFEELAGYTDIQLTQLQWPFQIQGRGQWEKDFLFAAEGMWHMQQQAIDVWTQHLTGQFGPYPFDLLQPLQMHYHPEFLQIAGLHGRWGEAELQAEFQQENQAFTSQFKTNAIPSELFQFFAPNRFMTGRASFEGHLEGSTQHPTGQMQIALHQVQISEDMFAQKPSIEGQIYLDLNQHGLSLKSALYGIGRTPVRIEGYLPVKVSLDPVLVKLEDHLPFDLVLQAEGDLDPYLNLFYNDITNLTGQAKIALRLNGHIQEPQIHGFIDLTNGSYESLSSGALFHHIQAHLEGNGSRIVLTQFSAQDKKGGTITATGGISLDASRHFPFEFQLHPSHIFIVDSDYAKLSASGPLQLVGNVKKVFLRGNLTVDQATIHLEETLPRQIKTVDVKYINVPPGERLPAYFEPKETTSKLELDVKVDLPQHVVIESSHLTSEWKGTIQVTGTPDHPWLNGDLRIVKGEYTLNSKIFNLNQGTIHFAGPAGKKTTLYIVASKDLDRIRAEIIVKGPVTKPVISFRSNPPLSQREVLSYILFNRGISDITSDQGEQLTQSFIDLNSSDQTSSNDDFLSRVRNNIGIDHLDFAASDSENQDFSLQVGKHITENILFSVNKSINAAPNRLALEVKLRKNVKVQADVGDDSQVRTSLKWKKDY